MMDCPFGKSIRDIKSKLDTLTQLVTFVLQKEELNMAKLIEELDALLAEVSANTTRIQSLDTLMDGIYQKLITILEGTIIDPVVKAKIDELFAGLRAQGAQVDAAIVEHTLPEEELPVE